MFHRLRLPLAAALSLALLPSLVAAETIDQNNAAATNLGLYGGEVRDVASDPASDYVYVTTYSPNGFFTSDDKGASWHGLDAEVYDLGEPRGVELDEDGNVYLLIGDALYKSTDNGTTLTEIGDLGGYGDNFLYTAAGTLIIGRTDGAVTVSTDGGENFETSEVIQANSYVLSLTASPTAGTFYATLDDTNNATLYISTDSGTNWTEVNTDDIANRYTTISADPNNADHLFMLSYGEDVDPWETFDAGATWDQLTDAATPGQPAYDSTGRIYLGSSYTDDQGATWGQVETITPANRVTTIWIDSEDDNRLYGSTFGAVAISTDRGTTWIDSNQGITAVRVQDVAQSTDKATVWIATGAGLAKTTDYTAEEPTWEFPINYDYYPSAVWIDPTDNNNVVVGGYLALYRTTDGGENWTTIDNWNSDYAVMEITSDPNAPATVYAIGAIQNTIDAIIGAVMMSTDSGATWTDLSITDSAASQAITVAKDGAVYVGAGQLAIRDNDTATGIYKYDGSSWTHLADFPDEQVTSLVADRDDADTIYATTSDFDSNQHSDGGVYKTTDGGSTWTKLSTTTSGLENASQYRVITIQNSTNTLYMAGTDTELGAGAIWKSTDGGASWGRYYVGLQSETFNTLLFDGLIAGNSRGAYDIRGKTDFGIKKTDRNITGTLQDAATAKKLKHKKVTLWKKKQGDWVKVDTDHTNRKGKATFRINPSATSNYRLKYVPTGNAAEEYTTSRSNIIKIKI